MIASESAVLVLLTKIEGRLILVDDRMINLRGDVVSLQSDVAELKSTSQTLKEGAAASKETAIALALALKEADETRRNKSEQTWSPFAKVITVIVAVVGLATLYLQIQMG